MYYTILTLPCASVLLVTVPQNLSTSLRLFPHHMWFGRCSAIVWWLGCRFDIWGILVWFLVEDEIFLIPETSGRPLGPTHSPVHWVLEALSLVVKWLDFEIDLSSSSIAEILSALLSHVSSWHTGTASSLHISVIWARD